MCVPSINEHVLFCDEKSNNKEKHFINLGIYLFLLVLPLHYPFLLLLDQVWPVIYERILCFTQWKNVIAIKIKATENCWMAQILSYPCVLRKVKREGKKWFWVMLRKKVMEFFMNYKYFCVVLIYDDDVPFNSIIEINCF